MFCCKSVADGFRLPYLMLQVSLMEGLLLMLRICSLLCLLKVLADNPAIAQKRRKPVSHINGGGGGVGQFLVVDLVSKTFAWDKRHKVAVEFL